MNRTVFFDSSSFDSGRLGLSVVGSEAMCHAECRACNVVEAVRPTALGVARQQGIPRDIPAKAQVQAEAPILEDVAPWPANPAVDAVGRRAQIVACRAQKSRQREW